MGQRTSRLAHRARLLLVRLGLAAAVGAAAPGCHGGEIRGTNRECVPPWYFPDSVCGTGDYYAENIQGGTTGCKLHADWCRNEDYRGPLPPGPNSSDEGKCCCEFTTIEPDGGHLE
jgi:hypothetical protein